MRLGAGPRDAGGACPGLALFDLDHTLIPFDSTLRWLEFLAGRGEIDPDLPARHLARCRDYVAGRLDHDALVRSGLAALAGRCRGEVAEWCRAFAAEVLPAAIPPAARRLVARHRDAGALCCLVTATADVVAAPFAEALGLPAPIASRAAVAGDAYSGELAGESCHGDAKRRAVGAWLAARGVGWGQAGPSVFYSDSASDLPLLAAVTEAVAVRPDAALRAHAQRHGWRIAEGLDDA